MEDFCLSSKRSVWKCFLESKAAVLPFSLLLSNSGVERGTCPKISVGGAMSPLPPLMRLWLRFSLNWDALYFLIWFLLKHVEENGDEKEEGNGKEEEPEIKEREKKKKKDTKRERYIDIYTEWVKELGKKYSYPWCLFYIGHIVGQDRKNTIEIYIFYFFYRMRIFASTFPRFIHETETSDGYMWF